MYDKLVIAKLDMLKKIKEEAVANMEFEKAIKAQEAIRITESVGENLNNIFKVKLRWIREGDQAQADLFDSAYKTVKETLEQYTFEFDEVQFAQLREIEKGSALMIRRNQLDMRIVEPAQNVEEVDTQIN